MLSVSNFFSSRQIGMCALAVAVAMASAFPSAASDGMRKHRSKEAIIISDAPTQVVKELGKRLDFYCELFDEFYEELGLKRKNTNTLKIRLFDSYADYETYYQRSTSSSRATPLAYYSPTLHSVVMYNDATDVALRAVVFHECSHQYLNRYSYNTPRWLNEGLAEYFEGWKVEPGVAGNRRPHLYDLALVRKVISKGSYLSPQELVEMGDEKFLGFIDEYPEHDSYLHYATAWSFVYFCLESGHEQDRERIIHYLREIGRTGASASFAVDNWEALTERWKRWITLFDAEPVDATDHFLIARGFRRDGEWTKAIESYERVLELDPKLPRTKTWLGYCLMASGNHARAVPVLEQACAEDPDEHWAAYLIAVIHLMPGPSDFQTRAKLAIEYAEKASGMVDDQNPSYLLILARCLAHLGQKKKAIRTAKKILKVVDKESREAWKGSVDEIIEMTRKKS